MYDNTSQKLLIEKCLCISGVILKLLSKLNRVSNVKLEVGLPFFNPLGVYMELNTLNCYNL